MSRRDANLLQEIILSVMLDNPRGVTHPQLVRRILETGYVSEDNSISEDVMAVTKRMIKKNMIKKNLETRVIQSGLCHAL